MATCTTDHPAGSTRHLQIGTNGRGLAVDCRKRTRGNDIHLVIFNLFGAVESQLYELIYAGAKYNIKRGRRVAPYSTAGHHDHVHVAVDRGVFIRWPASSRPAPPSLVVPPGVTVFNPPLVMRPIVSSAKDPVTGGSWLLGNDGSIYAFDGARYLGAPNGKSYFAGRSAHHLEITDDGRYRVVATSGERYGPGF